MKKKNITKILLLSIIFPGLAVLAFLLIEIIPLEVFGFQYQTVEKSSMILNNISHVDDTYVTSGNDPQILLLNVQNKIKNMELDINLIGETDASGELYFDYGEGMKQQEVQFIKLRQGKNKIHFNSKRKIIDLRIDPFNKDGIAFQISSIKFNEEKINIKKMVILILFVLLQLFFNLKEKKCILFSIVCTPIWYLWFKFYYNFAHMSIISFIYQILVFGFFISCIYILKNTFNNFKEDCK